MSTYIEKQIKKSGDSYVIYIPKKVLDETNMKLDDKVKVSWTRDNITIQKII